MKMKIFFEFVSILKQIGKNILNEICRYHSVFHKNIFLYTLRYFIVYFCPLQKCDPKKVHRW